MSVLSEMLAEMCPGQEKPADLELLRELYATCRNMQARLVELVDRVANDEITAHLLKINDDLNNLFLRYFFFKCYQRKGKSCVIFNRYERYERNRHAVTQGTGGLDNFPKTTTKPSESSLIDLDYQYPQQSASATAAALPTITTQIQTLGKFVLH